MQQIFPKLGVKYFNHDETYRKVINCECIIAGKTNIESREFHRVIF